MQRAENKGRMVITCSAPGMLKSVGQPCSQVSDLCSTRVRTGRFTYVKLLLVTVHLEASLYFILSPSKAVGEERPKVPSHQEPSGRLIYTVAYGSLY